MTGGVNGRSVTVTGTSHVLAVCRFAAWKRSVYEPACVDVGLQWNAPAGVTVAPAGGPTSEIVTGNPFGSMAVTLNARSVRSATCLGPGQFRVGAPGTRSVIWKCTAQ